MIKKHKIIIPFPTPKPAKDVKYKFSYSKPSYVNVVGSFALKTMVKETGGNNIELVVQMPSVCTFHLECLDGKVLPFCWVIFAHIPHRSCFKKKIISIIVTSTSGLTTWHVSLLVSTR